MSAWGGAWGGAWGESWGPPRNVGSSRAGKSTKYGIAIEDHKGTIHYFDTIAQAEAWISETYPSAPKAQRKAVRRVARETIRERAVPPAQRLYAPRMIEGPTELAQVVALRESFGRRVADAI